MKILSCYVENYGALSGRYYDFNDGITAVLEENGSGKTTLASFIQAMFYGLESYRNNSTEFCDRQHFYPFAGGAFGGNLTFEKDGKVYKIERRFGEKSATADELTVYCDGERTDELGENIGETVFGIDKDAFGRTAFIGNDEIEISSTGSINAKLSSLLHGVDDESDFDGAVALLEKTAKAYKKARMGKDKITDTETEIERLKSMFRNAETVRAALEMKYAEHAETKTLLQSLSLRIAKGQQRNERLAEWAHYEDLFALAENERQALQSITARYPYGVPTQADVEDLRILVKRKETYETQATRSAFTSADESKLALLEERFIGGVPSDETLNEMEKTVSLLDADNAKLELLQQRKPTDEERRLSQCFAHRTPTESELAELDELVKAHAAAQAEYAQTPERLTAVERAETKAKPKKGYGAAAIVALLVIGAGVALAFWQLAVGIVAIAVGFAAVLADGFFYLLQGQKATVVQERTTEIENPERLRKQMEVQALLAKLNAFLSPYGYAVDGEVAVATYAFRQDVKQFEEFSHAESERKKQVEETTRVRDERKARLEKCFQKYGVSAATPFSALAALRAATSEYAALSLRKDRANVDAQELDGKLRQTQKEIVAYAEKFGLQEVDLRAIERDVQAYQTAKENYAEKAAKAETYKREKSLDSKPQGEREDLGALNEELQALQKRLAALEKEISEDESVAEKADEYRADLDDAKDRLAEYKKRYALLSATVEFLKKAERALQERYVKPIKDGFLHYADLLERTLGERVTMTKNFEIRFDRHGQERSEKHLSAGQKSVCALCFRLALIKNMYAGQKPFLLLDDPFVHLDAKHLDKARALIKALANDFQIVYFTCHASRAL